MPNQRVTEFFGPDWGRGPFSSYRIETAALQIATALAQLRVPLLRDDEQIKSHAEFIRQLADCLAPDWAVQISSDVGQLSGGAIPTSILAATGTFSLLDCWLADSPGGGLTSTAPSSVAWTSGTVLQTIVERKRYLIVTPSTGVATVNVSYGGVKNWYWAICRQGRVYYSSQLSFF
ncbi:MAG: hypothetical protein KBH81_14180 [Phycisphaerae bacterium]|jgi:hypothetical protein|nr:hypothetical protein [Phycisphaerae bacterium]HOO17127.1 hypothetical protein [Phycisphaerae bacterium]HPC22606.1 hypothetical protein [Phycisphaerae bacterium]HRS28659.1 hypothetical protein [Phycisphaerae bacterium]HRT42821.1 hypothetical protein [Phycisphaerae bacterium]